MSFPDGWTVVPVKGISVTVSVPPFHAEAKWPYRQGVDDIHTVIQITDTSVDGGATIPPTRINVLSETGRTSLSRASGYKANSPQRVAINDFINQLCILVADLYREQAPITPLRIDQEPQPVKWLLYPIWPAHGAVGIAAAPASMKSYGALAIALSVATGTSVLRSHTRPGVQRPVLYLDWEADREENERRMRALAKGRGIDPEGAVSYMEMRHPLSEAVHDLAERAVDFGGIVVDSMSAAIGGSMVDDDRVNRFWDAVRAIGLPALVIAHKSVDNVRRREKRFFGSVMNEARVRMAWNVEREPDTTRVLWECFKGSNGRHHGTRLAWAWEFTADGEDDTETLQVVKAQGIDPQNVNLEPAKETTLADDIADVLAAEGPMTVKELAALLPSRSEQTIRTQLNRHDDRFLESSRTACDGGKPPCKPTRPDPI